MTSTGGTTAAGTGDADPVEPKWEHVIQVTAEYDEATAIAVASDGTLAVVGYSGYVYPENVQAAWVAKVSATPATLWERTLDAPGTDDWLGTVSFHPDGDLVVAGRIASQGVVARLSGADGATIWELPLPGEGWAMAAVAPDGSGVAVDRTGNVVHVLGFDETGAMSWSDEPAPCPDGEVWLGGVAIGAQATTSVGVNRCALNDDWGPGGWEGGWWIRHYDPIGGAMWTEAAPNPEIPDEVTGVTVASTGTWFVGTASSNSYDGWATVHRIASNGALDWWADIEAPGDPPELEVGVAIGASPDGGVVAVTFVGDNDGSRFHRFSPNGDLVWTRTVDPAVTVRSVAVTPEDDILLAGRTPSLGESDVWIGCFPP